MFDLTGQTALVTGASGGIGGAIARALHHQGAQVALAGTPGQANYAAAKAAMIGMAKSVAAEVATRGITVNCIAPGMIATAMTERLTDEQRARMAALIPMGRFGAAPDVAAAAVYLASAEAAYLTGHTLHVNGGMVMV